MREYENELKAIATGKVRKTIAMGLCNFSHIRCNTDSFQDCVRLGYATYNPNTIGPLTLTPKGKDYLYG